MLAELAADKDLPRELGTATLRMVSKALASSDWDGDGCPDFGDDVDWQIAAEMAAEAKPAPSASGARRARGGGRRTASQGTRQMREEVDPCAAVPPNDRPRLLAALLVKTDIGDQPRLTDGLTDDRRRAVLAFLSWRLATNARITNSAHRQAWMQAVAEIWSQGEVLSERLAAVIVLRELVRSWPMAEQAEQWQRSLVTNLDWSGRIVESRQRRAAKRSGRLRSAGEATTRPFAAELFTGQKRYLALYGTRSPWRRRFDAKALRTRGLESFERSIRRQVARRLDAEARKSAAQGDDVASFSHAAAAAAAYEAALAVEPNPLDAHALMFAAAEANFMAGKRCDGVRDADGTLVRLANGTLQPHLADQRALVETSCVYARRAATWYGKVMNWQGSKGVDAAGRPLDHRDEAAHSALVVRERLLVLRASLPAGHPRHLEARMVPELRPDQAEVDRLVDLNRNALEPVRVEPLSLDPEVVAWMKAAGIGGTNAIKPSAIPSGFSPLTRARGR